MQLGIQRLIQRLGKRPPISYTHNSANYRAISLINIAIILLVTALQNPSCCLERAKMLQSVRC